MVPLAESGDTWCSGRRDQQRPRGLRGRRQLGVSELSGPAVRSCASRAGLEGLCQGSPVVEGREGRLGALWVQVIFPPVQGTSQPREAAPGSEEKPRVWGFHLGFPTHLLRVAALCAHLPQLSGSPMGTQKAEQKLLGTGTGSKVWAAKEGWGPAPHRRAAGCVPLLPWERGEGSPRQQGPWERDGPVALC